MIIAVQYLSLFTIVIKQVDTVGHTMYVVAQLMFHKSI